MTNYHFYYSAFLYDNKQMFYITFDEVARLSKKPALFAHIKIKAQKEINVLNATGENGVAIDNVDMARNLREALAFIMLHANKSYILENIKGFKIYGADRNYNGPKIPVVKSWNGAWNKEEILINILNIFAPLSFNETTFTQVINNAAIEYILTNIGRNEVYSYDSEWLQILAKFGDSEAKHIIAKANEFNFDDYSAGRLVKIVEEQKLIRMEKVKEECIPMLKRLKETAYKGETFDVFETGLINEYHAQFLRELGYTVRIEEDKSVMVEW